MYLGHENRQPARDACMFIKRKRFLWVGGNNCVEIIKQWMSPLRFYELRLQMLLKLMECEVHSHGEKIGKIHSEQAF